MPLYVRKIKTRLTIVRAFFCLAIGFAIYLALSGYKDYSYVLLFLLAGGAVFPLTGLSLTTDILTIRQYYVYGLVFRTWIFDTKDNIEIEPLELEISDAGYQNTDAWWDIFLVLLPASKVSVKKFIIKHTDILGNKTQVKTRLPQKEQALLQNTISRTGNAYNIG